MYFICKASINRQLYCPPTTTTTHLRQREQARRIERCPVSLSHAFRFRVQGIKIYDIFITKTSAVSCGRTTGFPTPLLPFMHTHSATTLTSKICSQARQAIIWTWAMEAATATRRNAEKD